MSQTKETAQRALLRRAAGLSLSLATNASRRNWRAGCGCACGIGLCYHYTPPVLGEPVYPPPPPSRPIRPAHKSKSHHATR